MEGLANSAAFWVLLILLLCVLYLLPTLIAALRRTDQLLLVFVVNLIGGTTGVGWLAAMILAFLPRRLPPVPAVPVSWPPDRLPFPRQPQQLNEAHNVIVMRAEAGQPNHFARRKANSRDARRQESVSR